MYLDKNTMVKISNLLNIEEVKSDVNFWMIRTKKGFFYDEFISKEFVALGWNIIDNKVIDYIGTNRTKNKEIKTSIEYKYNSKQGTQILNKCIRFMREIKIGDIIMIPSRRNEEITFAIAGKYFEVDNLNYEKEIEIISRIDNNIDYGTEMICPYKKRRKIKILKKVNGERLNPNLYKVLASYHGISNIDGYAEYILSSIYNIYLWKNRLNAVFNVEKEGDIDAIALSSFIYNSSSLINSFDEGMHVTARVNLNSPGNVILTIQNITNETVNILASHKTLLAIAFIWMLITGGELGPIKFNSLLELIMKFREQNSKLKSDKLDRELKQIQIKKENIELTDEMVKQAEKIKVSSESLQINKDDAKKVINLNSYRDEKDD
ncbi:hypothetical protein CLTEP_02090 [Clostridium tepidiprofundi DSM 19306]|uniref:Uncharacterized protein n=1 Tax=Clostridium tepidiprofundi DSM 19306 TaxID=1121338 RepID=A0A151B7D5_9CLOT|nr:hypothetical protein [Clostridium tepidiprofundi]KYH35816.1 hypothetical protein CLTEP_02090 [Clostridium tepidiprofundi DSM 19306]